MGISEYLRGIFNVGGEEEFEAEAVQETVESEETEKERTPKAAPRKVYTSRRGQNDEEPTAMRMVLSRPEIISDAVSVADDLKMGKTVVLNLEKTEKANAQRIVDFLSGAAHVMSFQFKPVSNRTYVIIPKNADFSGDFILDDFGNENYLI
ncbi:MAG: cell division protein SepF [Clostridia bacterium]|nr:cell division protein SepF [Clostridia bacterium]